MQHEHSNNGGEGALNSVPRQRGHGVWSWLLMALGALIFALSLPDYYEFSDQTHDMGLSIAMGVLVFVIGLRRLRASSHGGENWLWYAFYALLAMEFTGPFWQESHESTHESTLRNLKEALLFREPSASTALYLAMAALAILLIHLARRARRSSAAPGPAGRREKGGR